MNEIPSKVAAYSFKKLNPGLDVYISYLEDYPILLKNHDKPFYRSGRRLVWDTSKHQSFFPVRFLCAETHRKMKRDKRWILVIDPDVFCLKKLDSLNSFINAAEAINKNLIAWNSNSSVMLVDTEKISWSEQSLIEDVFLRNDDFDKYMFLRNYPHCPLPRQYNMYDVIKDETIMLHTTNTETQPWKTGVQYLEWELHNKPRHPNARTLTFREHPNQKVKNTVFSLFKESYEDGQFTLKDIELAIANRALRSDIKEVIGLDKP